MKLSKIDLQRLIRSVSGQQWQIQGREVIPVGERDELTVAWIGRSKDEVIAQVQLDFAEDIVTMNNLLPAAIVDLQLAEKWRATALELMALCITAEKTDAGVVAKCNVCGMANAHMPGCKLLPQVNNVLWLDKQEKANGAEPSGPKIEVVG